MNKRHVVAVIPSRGDVSLIVEDKILRTVDFAARVLWWNNRSAPVDMKVMGRFMVLHAEDALIYTQDDDVLVPDARHIVQAAQAAEGLIVCNMPKEFRRYYQSNGLALLGFGSCFPGNLVQPTFARYLKHFPFDEFLLMECDRIFTGLNANRIVMVDVKKENLPHATDANRMYQQPGHEERLKLAIERIAEIKRREALPS